MAFAEALKEHLKGPGSVVDRVLDELDPKDADAARAALADRSIGPTPIARAFKELGHAVTERNIRTYRERL